VLKRSVLAAALPLLLGACSVGGWTDSMRRWPGPDDLIAMVPWFATMHQGLAVQPYKWPAPRPPVAGSIPVTGSEPALPVIPANLAAINAVRNPVPRTAASLEAGKQKFDTYCLPCHGGKGAGDGLVNKKLLVAPSLLTDQARQYTDGYIHAMVRNGRGIMPAYGDRIFGDDRWNVVNYVRLLQGVAK
jgi:mono/diheme cytochrome c family protein